MRNEYLRAIVVSGALFAVAAGCGGRVSYFPNSDPALRRKPAEFAADAASRHPYKADAPRGGEINGRAQVGYWVDHLDVANLSNADWDNVEVWVNQAYVVHVPKIPARRTWTFNFEMLYDAAGHHFPTSKTEIKKVEIYMDGRMYDVPVKLADT
jgi:hypothetical protein